MGRFEADWFAWIALVAAIVAPISLVLSLVSTIKDQEGRTTGKRKDTAPGVTIKPGVKTVWFPERELSYTSDPISTTDLAMFVTSLTLAVVAIESFRASATAPVDLWGVHVTKGGLIIASVIVIPFTLAGTMGSTDGFRKWPWQSGTYR